MPPFNVIPTQVGIYANFSKRSLEVARCVFFLAARDSAARSGPRAAGAWYSRRVAWVPAFAGMTGCGGKQPAHHQRRPSAHFEPGGRSGGWPKGRFNSA